MIRQQAKTGMAPQSSDDMDLHSVAISRQSLAALGLTLAGIFSSSCSPEITPANQALRDFPNIPSDLATVQKYEEPGAKRVFVHIRQIHHTPGIDGAYKDWAVQTQRQIEDVLRKMITDTSISSVMVEGVMADEQSAQALSEISLVLNDPRFQDRLHLLEDIFDPVIKNKLAQCRATLAKLEGEPSRFVTLYQRQEKDLIEQGIASLRLFCGGVGKLSAEGKLKIVGCEQSDLHSAQGSSLSTLRQKIQLGWISNTALVDFAAELRENFLLGQIPKMDQTLAVAVYGGAHDFSGNVVKWNQDHPDNKISFIEITPKAMAQFDKIHTRLNVGPGDAGNDELARKSLFSASNKKD